MTVAASVANENWKIIANATVTPYPDQAINQENAGRVLLEGPASVTKKLERWQRFNGCKANDWNTGSSLMFKNNKWYVLNDIGKWIQLTDVSNVPNGQANSVYVYVKKVIGTSIGLSDINLTVLVKLS